MPPANPPTVRTGPVVRDNPTTNSASELSDQQAPVVEESTQPDNPSDLDPNLARWGTAASEYVAGICLGLFGVGGAGKTTLAATAVDSLLGSPAMLYNAASNPHVIRSRGSSVIVKDINFFRNAEEERQKILRSQKTFPFKTVIWDNLSELHAMALRDKYGPTTEVQWEMHSATTAEFKQFVRNWRDLSTNPNLMLNVIFILWETPEKRKVRNVDCTVADIELSGRLQSTFSGLIPFLGQLYISTTREPWTRCLDFRPNNQERVSKFQVDPSDEYARSIPMQIFNPSMASIIDTIKGHKPWPTEKHLDPMRAKVAAKPATQATDKQESA